MFSCRDLLILNHFLALLEFFPHGIWAITPEENCLRLGLAYGLRLRLVLGLGAIFLGGNCPRTFPHHEYYFYPCYFFRQKNAF